MNSSFADSMLPSMYSTTFGNGAFEIRPPKKNSMEDGFQSIPYIPIEAIFYQQQSNTPAVAPYNITTGSTSGTMNIRGSQTVTDSTGNVRVQIGYGEF